MKKVLYIYLFLFIGCSGVQVPYLDGGKDKIRHSDIRKVYFNIENNELVWSRLHYYVYICLGYPPVKSYNPYLINVRGDNPYRDLVIVREVGIKQIRIVMSYTADVRAKRITEISKKVKYIGNPKDVMRIKIKLDDMLEYAGTGKHKQKPKRDVLKKNKVKKDDRKGDDFYPY